jgi:NarL family two-component system response regulator LiaR
LVTITGGKDAFVFESRTSPNGVDLGAPSPLRVALVNDFEVVVAGLASMLRPFEPAVVVVDLAVDRLTRPTPIDIALFDTFGRPGPEPERVRDLLAQPHVGHVAIYSFDIEPERVAAALDLGVQGYIWKGTKGTELVRDLHRICRGEVVVATSSVNRRRTADAPWPGRERGLSRRESEILALLVQGLSNRQIADALYLSSETVKTHVRGLYRKLGVNNRVKAAAAALADPDFRRTSGPTSDISSGPAAASAPEPAHASSTVGW